ncbi:hypothetical protein ACIBCM_01445 [Streptomyces sp. NPDC051018]|uniref:hypothetical protein n=1 Tax=Streptomyces sp. NPDC051018 TaxID=3365639 RepID=UPI0037B93C4E
MTVRILVEGNGFHRAAEDLAALPGVHDDVELLTADPTNKEPVLVTVAAVVGIAAGSAALAEQIMRWWKRWKGRPDRPDRVVMVLVDGRRIALDSLDEAALARLLAPPPEQDD